MSTQTPDSVLLLIRGTLNTGADSEAGRKIHNATAGNDAGVAAAKSLGDLSHKVYVPAVSAGTMAGAKPDEFLIMDVWETADGIQKFFSNPQVSEGGAKLFSSRDPAMWMPARGAFTFNLPAPMNRSDRYIGVIRATVKSPEQAMEVFRASMQKHVNQARQRGQLSHELYFRMGPPGTPLEMLGIDVWTDLKGMGQQYGEHMGELSKAFAGTPITSIWTPPPGSWIEW